MRSVRVEGECSQTMLRGKGPSWSSGGSRRGKRMEQWAVRPDWNWTPQAGTEFQKIATCFDLKHAPPFPKKRPLDVRWERHSHWCSVPPPSDAACCCPERTVHAS